MPTLISGGTVIAYDGQQHTVVPGGDVVLEQDRIIHANGPWTGPFDERIDATGLLVTPGLINTHVHCMVQGTAIATMDEGRRDMYGSGYLAYQPKMGQRTPLTVDEQRWAFEFSIAGLLRSGSTTIIEMGIVSGGPDLLAETVGELGIRCYTGPGYRSADYFIDADDRLQYRWDEEKGFTGLKQGLEFFDKWGGAFSGRLQAMLIPRNADTCSPELLKASAKEAKRLDCLVQIHTAQHLVEFHEIVSRHKVTPVMFLEQMGLLSDKTFLGHCVYVTGHSMSNWRGDEDLDIIARNGTHIAHSPLVFIRNGRLLESFQRYRRHGINMTMATDTFPQDLVNEMRIGSYGCKLLEKDYGAATAWDMFNAATLAGAKGLHRDDLGRLAPGAKADIVLWDLRKLRNGPYVDPVKALIHTGTGDDCVLTMVDGRVVYDGKTVAGRTEHELVARAQKVGDKVWGSRWPERFPAKS